MLELGIGPQGAGSGVHWVLGELGRGSGELSEQGNIYPIALPYLLPLYLPKGRF